MKKLISLAALVVSLATVGWLGHYEITGGGALVGSDGTHLATLTLDCEDCSSAGTAASGHFNYVAHQGNAHLHGELFAHVACDPTDGRYADDCLLFCDASLLPGAHLLYGRDDDGGSLAACIKDNGQGQAPPDQAVVIVRPSGAGQGFRRISAVVQGNFVLHAAE
jgi:hypothetical protein